MQAGIRCCHGHDHGHGVIHHKSFAEAFGMAGEDVDVLEGGGLRASVDPVLLQPLVVGGAAPPVSVPQKTRLASLDVFRGLAIVVGYVMQDDITLFLNPNFVKMFGLHLECLFYCALVAVFSSHDYGCGVM